MQTDTSRKTNWLGSCLSTLFFMGIFFVIGAGLAYWGWTILQTARASASWPSVEGLVTRSGISHSTDSDGADSYSPEVTFQYQVEGTQFESTTIKFGENAYDNRRKAEEIIASYPSGKRVAVYYDPEQPQRSVLEPGVSAGSYIVLGIGALFVLLSLILSPIIFFLRNRG